MVVAVVVVVVGVSWMAKVCEGADVESPVSKERIDHVKSRRRSAAERDNVA